MFPVNGSLHTAPRFPRSGPGKSGSPMSQVLLRCYDFPPRISGYLFASLQESCCHHPCKARFRLAGLAFTGRASNPLDRCKRFQIIHPPFLDLAWRKGSFILNLPLASHHSITSSARASSVGGTSRSSAL